MDETTQKDAPKQNSKMIIIGVVVVLAIIGGYLFMKNGSSQQMETTEDTTGTEQSANDVVEESDVESMEAGDDSESMMEVRVIEVEAGSFYYKPDVMKVKKGETVRIVMKSVSMMHNFNIDELGVKIPVTQDGDTATVEFVADKAGTFEYYCSVGNHRAQGQVGMITVE